MKGGTRRTGVEVDGAPLDEARRAPGPRKGEEAAEAALRLPAKLKEQEETLGLAGEMRQEGDLGGSRGGRRSSGREAAPRG